MAIRNLHDLFVHSLRDIYFAEQTILRKLPDMASKASSVQLRTALETHLAETRGHVARLEQVFEMLGEEVTTEGCPAIEGITEEADELIAEIADPETRDAALMGTAQAVEHYEIARYGTLIAWAEEMSLDNAVQLLQKNLDEEKAADIRLTQLGESRLNRRAA